MDTDPEIAFLETIVKGLVEFPDSVRVSRSTDDMGVLLSLAVDRNDMGRIIGREGSTAKALRTIMHVRGMKMNARLSLKIEEPEGSNYKDNRASDKDILGL